MSDATPACEILAPAGSHADGLDALPDESRAAYHAGYQAGLVSGRETGYRQGYRDGFSDGSHHGQASAAQAPKGEEYTGQRLLGLPCASCGCCFYSDEARCPRCKSPRNEPCGETISAGEI